MNVYYSIYKQVKWLEEQQLLNFSLDLLFCSIFTNQEENFESCLFKFLCEVLQIQNSSTTPANGQVEGVNTSTTFMDAVDVLLTSCHRTIGIWTIYLSKIRSSINRHTEKVMMSHEISDLHTPWGLYRAITGISLVISNVWVLKIHYDHIKRSLWLHTRAYELGDSVYVWDGQKWLGQKGTSLAMSMPTSFPRWSNYFSVRFVGCFCICITNSKTVI